MFNETVLEQMAAEPIDVLVIGGGIVGAGVARDAAMRGLRVALAEQYDFASGTSGRTITPCNCDATGVNTSPGVSSVTSPGCARAAPRTASTAAPW